MDMESIIGMITNVGFPITLVLLIGCAVYKIGNRLMDENKAREAQMMEQNEKLTLALSDISNTIKQSNELNSNLSETNRLLVDKIADQINGINNNINDIANALKK